ncbi:unnamed protein product, partial [Commensalibacter communis]|uniref:hypothetical protein n=1 Tax=Commensalibacter communis TaxID=2972786 RepID=UPI0022FF81BD
DPDQQAKAEIIPGENGNNILNLGLVKGDKGQNGKNGQNGQDGKSYINDGSQVLNVRGLQIANIQSINVDDVPENTICLNEDSKQLVIRKNNSWKVLNMNNFEVETTYNNNNGVLPINFAIDNFTPSSNAKSTAEGLTTGYLSPDTSKSLLTPMNTLIRVDFKIASSDTTDSDYFIVGYENSLNIRINPGKKFVSVYSGNNKSYEMDYTAFGINLHDNKFHTAYFLLNCGYKGLTAYAIDGHYFNRSSAQTFLYMSSLRIRGTSTISVPENAMIVCNIGLSSILPSLKNNQAVSSDFTSFEGYYSCKNNSFTNQNSTNGILLKPFSNYDCFNSIQPYYIGDNQAFFNEDGCYKGSVAINAPYMFDSFTFECYFKYDSTYDTLYSMRRSIVGNMETYYSIGLQAGTVNKFTFKDYVAKTEITLVEELEKDKWHTLSISCFNKQAYIFIDGILTGVVPFAFYWNNIFLRACKSDNYVSPEKALYIKYVSFTIGEAKYFNHYDSSLTPTSPSNNNSYFYPLIDGRVANENTHSPLVQIDLNEGDSFDLHNVPLGETSGGFMNLIPIHYTYSNKPLVFNTKNTHIFIKNITGNPLKGTV